MLLTGYLSWGQQNHDKIYCPAIDPPARTDPDAPYNFSETDKVPEFINGITTFRKKIEENIKFPPPNKKGDYRIIVTFVIEKDGSYSNIKILRNTAPENLNLDKQAISAISLSPKAKPGEIKGKPVRTNCTIPLYLKF